MTDDWETDNANENVLPNRIDLGVTWLNCEQILVIAIVLVSLPANPWCQHASCTAEVVYESTLYEDSQAFEPYPVWRIINSFWSKCILLQSHARKKKKTEYFNKEQMSKIICWFRKQFFVCSTILPTPIKHNAAHICDCSTCYRVLKMCQHSHRHNNCSIDCVCLCGVGPTTMISSVIENVRVRTHKHHIRHSYTRSSRLHSTP